MKLLVHPTIVLFCEIENLSNYLYYLDNLSKDNFVVLNSTITSKNGKVFISSDASPWGPYNTFVLSIKIRRKTNDISAEYFPANKMGNNWTNNNYEFTIDETEFSLTDLVSVEILCMRKQWVS